MGFFNKLLIPNQPMTQKQIINKYIQEFESIQKRNDTLVGERYYNNKNNIKVNLTLDNHVYVTDVNTNEKLQGKQEEFKDKYKNMLFSDKFDNVRRQIIVDSIRKDLEYYSSLNNQISLKNGWGYTLKLPLIDEKAINDITFIAFLQGLPLNGIELYNTYGFGVARVVRKNNVYGNEESGVKYYHI